MYKKYLIFVMLLINAMVLAGCGQLLNASVGMKNMQEETTLQEEMRLYEITDADTDVTIDNAKEIYMNEIDETTLIISEGGDYILSGRNDNCNILINAYEDENVHLFLRNTELAAESGPVIYVEKAGKVIVTLLEGTINTISDSPEYMTEAEACIFSNSDLTINGKGMLSVYGYYHDAIRSKDRLKVVETSLSVKAKNNALRGNDGVVMQDSMLEIESEGTGILANNAQSYVVLQGGKCKVISGENAIAADSYVLIQDCEYDLYSVLETAKCSGIKKIEEED